MSLSLAQLIFPGFRWGETEVRAAEKLAAGGVGGFCLYGGTVSQVIALVERLQKKAPLPLLFCSDLEEGAGQQFEGATHFPSNMAVGAGHRPEHARLKGRITGLEARILGVRWALAPVVDLSTRPENPIVNIRAFGENPETVRRMAQAYLRGLRGAGVLGCLKHFPGHGDTRTDSHLNLPVIHKNLRQLWGQELLPYRKLKNLGGSIMVGHLKFPDLDPQLPASLSPKILGGLLRRKLGFKGLVITDALNMGGAIQRGGQETLLLKALSAGADVLLFPPDPFSALRQLQKLTAKHSSLSHRAQEALHRIHGAKKALGLLRDGGLPLKDKLPLLGSLRHQRYAEKIARDALTWVFPPSTPPRSGSTPYGLHLLGNPTPSQRQILLKELGLSGDKSRCRTARHKCVAIFSRPRAFRGSLSLKTSDAAAFQAHLRRRRECIFISFGDPYLLSRTEGSLGSLCAFSDCPASLNAAAQALLGKTPAPGKLPVTMGEKHSWAL